LPNQSGNHIAQFKETLDTKGLVTGATYLEEKNLLHFVAILNTGNHFYIYCTILKIMIFCPEINEELIFSFLFHQIEGIATNDGLHYYLTNEALVRKPVLNVHQQIHYFDLSPILNSYLHK
jgi:hypothetical protein